MKRHFATLRQCTHTNSVIGAIEHMLTSLSL
jgi:hypothetical protein